jgi:hypothetical protein
MVVVLECLYNMKAPAKGISNTQLLTPENAGKIQ